MALTIWRSLILYIEASYGIANLGALILYIEVSYGIVDVRALILYRS